MEYVEKNCDVVEIYGESGSQIVQRLAVLPLGLSLQVGLCSSANGAVVDIFPGKGSPLSIIAINLNASQTSKSQLAQLVEVAAVNDAASRRRATAWSDNPFGNSPRKFVPCLTGSSGQHDVATRERLLQTTGRPIEPHARLPSVCWAQFRGQRAEPRVFGCFGGSRSERFFHDLA